MVLGAETILSCHHCTQGSGESFALWHIDRIHRLFCLRKCGLTQYLHLRCDICWPPLSRALASCWVASLCSLDHHPHQTCCSSSEIMHSSETNFRNFKEITIQIQAYKVYMPDVFHVRIALLLLLLLFGFHNLSYNFIIRYKMIM
jgi:hypothetical protein